MTGIGPLQKTLDTASNPLPGSIPTHARCHLRLAYLVVVVDSAQLRSGIREAPPARPTKRLERSRRFHPPHPTRRKRLAPGACGKGGPSHTSFSQRPSEIQAQRQPPPRTGRRRGSSSLRVRLSMNREREGRIFQQIDRSFGCRKERRQPKFTVWCGPEDCSGLDLPSEPVAIQRGTQDGDGSRTEGGLQCAPETGPCQVE